MPIMPRGNCFSFRAVPLSWTGGKVLFVGKHSISQGLPTAYLYQVLRQSPESQQPILPIP